MVNHLQISADTRLETNRTALRYPNLNDAREIFSVVQSSEFPELLPLKEMDSLEKIETWLNRLAELWEKGWVYSWIVEERDSGRLLGQVTLSKIEGDNRGRWHSGYIQSNGAKVMQLKAPNEFCDSVSKNWAPKRSGLRQGNGILAAIGYWRS